MLHDRLVEFSHPPSRLQTLLWRQGHTGKMRYIPAVRTVLVPGIYQMEPYTYFSTSTEEYMPEYINYGTLGSLLSFEVARIVNRRRKGASRGRLGNTGQRGRTGSGNSYLDRLYCLLDLHSSLGGTLPRCVTDILGTTLTEVHDVAWCPAHVGLRGNEEANCVARGLAGRAAGPCSGHPTGHHEEHNITSRQILEDQRLTRRNFKNNVSGTPSEQHNEIFRMAQGLRLAYNALLANFRAASPDYDVFSSHWPEAEWAFFVRSCMVHCTADQVPRPLTPRERCLLPLHNMDEFAGAFGCRTKPGFVRGSCLM
ncbi:hypothetical protein HPB50_016783 [Hyalomma asiaticum]|uniref:Uncharacterized protein n=1 Tax=Hyalomma asiaticum TaxID=266040 RepID=A0ACB7SR52_HYAAI|nr:hypothetical protein HPB50_016783 [Hyalomma asiaticum]